MTEVLHLITKEVTLLCLEGDTVLTQQGEHLLQVGEVRLRVSGVGDDVVRLSGRGRTAILLWPVSCQ